MAASEEFYCLPKEQHTAIVSAAFQKRGFTGEESMQAAKLAELASWHGIRTHNCLKALHLDDVLGSGGGHCVPGAEIEVLPSKYKAVQKWDAHKKMGAAVGFAAMEECMRLADEFGVGIVAVDNCFHYLWGGGYVMEAAKKGYIAYTNCTAALTEVVPYGGVAPTLGTNPHSWAFPTVAAVGFPVVVDWATSVVAMGRVQQFRREGTALPAGCAVDAEGKETTDANKVRALLPFGAHKGYGLSLVDELYTAYTGGSLPTLRCRGTPGSTDKHSTTFFFQAIKPDAIACSFAQDRTMDENVKAVLDDILGHGNKDTGRCLLPGEIEAKAAARSEKAGALLFSKAEIDEIAKLGEAVGLPIDVASLDKVTS